VNKLFDQVEAYGFTEQVKKIPLAHGLSTMKELRYATPGDDDHQGHGFMVRWGGYANELKSADWISAALHDLEYVTDQTVPGGLRPVEGVFTLQLRPSHKVEAEQAVGDAWAVDHPKHYTSHPSGVECIEITEHMNFNLGNAMKYIWRAGLKGKQLTDLRKAAFYINREIKRLEKNG